MKSFLKEALSSIKTTGTIKPSSKYLVNDILKNVDFEQVRNIVEFGPGNGVITHEIVNRMHKDARLICFEINEAFYNHCKQTFAHDSRVVVLQESAFEVDAIAPRNGMNEVDVVVSSLPLSLFDEDQLNTAMSSMKAVMSDQGALVQYQYSLGKYFFLKKHFPTVKIGFTARNLPPAFVYYCYR